MHVASDILSSSQHWHIAHTIYVMGVAQWDHRHNLKMFIFCFSIFAACSLLRLCTILTNLTYCCRNATLTTCCMRNEGSATPKHRFEGSGVHRGSWLVSGLFVSDFRLECAQGADTDNILLVKIQLRGMIRNV